MSKKSARVVEKEKQKAAVKSSTSGEYGLEWKIVGSFYALDSPQLKGSPKIAAFDMDHTLVQPKSKAKFPTGRNDWTWWNEKVPEKLKELNKNGYKIVIFTNQGGIEKNKQNKNDITGKILDLASELGFPIQAFVAAAEDQYRKPFTTMWDNFVKSYNGGVQPDMKVSFYCGDAAGRHKGWKTGANKDFSAGDRKFAFNCKLTFQTPETLFLEEKETDKWEWGSIDPTSLTQGDDKPHETKDVISKTQEMVIMVGRPASGKSTFTEKHFVPSGYVRVNRDILKTQPKCKKAVEAALSEGKSVVIDNTNPSVSARADYIQIAQSYQVPVRCFYFDTSIEIANHLNYVRVQETNGDVRRIPNVGYHVYNKNFEEPDESEGFEEVKLIKFIPSFKNDTHKKYFMCINPEF